MDKPKQYERLPFVVTAIQYTGNNAAKVADLANSGRRYLARFIALAIVLLIVLWALPATGPACLDSFSCEAEGLR